MDSLVVSIRPITLTITQLQTWISLLLQQMSCITFMGIKQLRWTKIELKLAELVAQLICLSSQFEIKAPTIYLSSPCSTKHVYANTIILCTRSEMNWNPMVDIFISLQLHFLNITRSKYKCSKNTCTTLLYKALCKFWMFTCWLMYLNDRCDVCFIDTFSMESWIPLNHHHYFKKIDVITMKILHKPRQYSTAA